MNSRGRLHIGPDRRADRRSEMGRQCRASRRPSPFERAWQDSLCSARRRCRPKPGRPDFATESVRLAALVRPAAENPHSALQLKELLQKTLPGHMIPARIIFTDEFRGLQTGRSIDLPHI
jgi:hypothetical protein